MVATERFEQIHIECGDALWAWLDANYSRSKGVWLVTFKKNIPEKYVSTSEVLDALISYGWIDGIRRKVDDSRTMQLITPRRVQHWSATYKLRAEKLIQQGKMHDSGLKTIEVSKESGLWNAMDDVDQLQIPADLKNAFSGFPEALAFFHAINPSSKRFALRWLKIAKSSETRNKRIQHLVELSKNGEKLKGS